MDIHVAPDGNIQHPLGQNPSIGHHGADIGLQIPQCLHILVSPEIFRLEHWDIVGDGTERKKLEALAQEKLCDRTNITWKFHGAIPNAELADYYHTLAPQLFITTSSTEGGAPVSIQEVFSMGIPAIGTEVGGIPDLILEGKTGFLLPQEVEPSHVAAAILRFAALNDEQKRQMSDAARKHWEQNFNAVRNAEQFTGDLLELVSK
jgi:glycosyltransferase involved in cell wall biosynthesis